VKKTEKALSAASSMTYFWLFPPLRPSGKALKARRMRSTKPLGVKGGATGAGAGRRTMVAFSSDSKDHYISMVLN
jgi:hypothetical protein